jgi:hypothetical protein
MLLLILRGRNLKKKLYINYIKKKGKKNFLIDNFTQISTFIFFIKRW